jgi:hypothetical protein
MPVMVWSHTFVVRASVEDVYRYGFSPEVTLTVRPDSAYFWAKPLIWLISHPFKKITPKAMESFAAMVEACLA